MDGVGDGVRTKQLTMALQVDQYMYLAGSDIATSFEMPCDTVGRHDPSSDSEFRKLLYGVPLLLEPDDLKRLLDFMFFSSLYFLMRLLYMRSLLSMSKL